MTETMPLDHCFATYGTLAPGRPNYHQLAELKGRWLKGTVRGHLVERGWGAAMGYPALVPAADGEVVEVHLLLSPDLPKHWDRLDAFEGEEYQRTRISVTTDEGVFDAWIYLDAS